MIPVCYDKNMNLGEERSTPLAGAEGRTHSISGSAPFSNFPGNSSGRNSLSRLPTAASSTESSVVALRELPSARRAPPRMTSGRSSGAEPGRTNQYSSPWSAVKPDSVSSRADTAARIEMACPRVGTMPVRPASCGSRAGAYAFVACTTCVHDTGPRGVSSCHRRASPSVGIGLTAVTGVCVCNFKDTAGEAFCASLNSQVTSLRGHSVFPGVRTAGYRAPYICKDQSSPCGYNNNENC